jgi:hypothetical protein
VHEKSGGIPTGTIAIVLVVDFGKPIGWFNSSLSYLIKFGYLWFRTVDGGTEHTSKYSQAIIRQV